MSPMHRRYKTLEDVIGAHAAGAPACACPGADNERRGNVILGKLEGNNPAGSVKDRPAISMIRRAEERGDIKPGDTLIEATSGNTGIALAMAAAIRGYRMVLIMPEDLSHRARADHEGLRCRADPHAALAAAWSTRATWPSRCSATARAACSTSSPTPTTRACTTRPPAPRSGRDTDGRITHFVSAMGTTGTITGVSRYLKEQNPAVRVIGAQPAEGSRIPGIRKWPEAYLPKIYDPTLGRRDWCYVSQADAEDMARRLAREEGLFAGISAAGACWVALQIAEQVENATIVFIVCDRGDRYLSTGVFPA